MANAPPSNENASNEPPPPRKGWLDDLAHRSAGIMPHTPPDLRHTPQEKSGWSYAGKGIEFAGTTAIFAVMGVFVDRYFNTLPWATLVLSSLGFIGGLYLLIKDALKENAEPRKGAGKHSPPQG